MFHVLIQVTKWLSPYDSPGKRLEQTKLGLVWLAIISVQIINLMQQTLIKVKPSSSWSWAWPSSVPACLFLVSIVNPSPPPAMKWEILLCCLLALSVPGQVSLCSTSTLALLMSSLNSACYWPNFDETVNVGSWDLLERISTVTVMFVHATFVLARFFHIMNISAVTDPICIKH